MTKGRKYQTEYEINFKTQKGREVAYVNTQMYKSPDSRKVNTYENLNLSYPKNTAESPKQVSNDSQLVVPVSIARSIRCLQVTCVALVFVIIIMAAILGSVMSNQKTRLDSIEGKTDLLHSEKDHAGAENNSDVKITRIESDLQKTAAAFQKYKTTALETKSNNYSEIIKYQGIRISALEVSLSQQVAFTVKSPANIPSSSTMRFSTIITNIGEGYNTTSGKFTCRVEGIYFFALSLSKARTDTRIYGFVGCYIRKNYNKLIRAYIDPTADDTEKGGAEVSGFITISLSPGDIIDVGECCFNSSAYHSRSSFSGFLFLAI